MEKWLIKVLKDVSSDHKISDEKAKNLLNRILYLLFNNGKIKFLEKR